MALVEIISNNYCTLSRCLEPSNELLGHLQSIAFVNDQIAFIRQQATPDDKKNALLSALSEVPHDLQQSVVKAFIAALRSCGQDHVANIFRAE